MTIDTQGQHEEWLDIQEEYAEAEKDVHEATERLEKVRQWRDRHIETILFGII